MRKWLKAAVVVLAVLGLAVAQNAYADRPEAGAQDKGTGKALAIGLEVPQRLPGGVNEAIIRALALGQIYNLEVSVSGVSGSEVVAISPTNIDGTPVSVSGELATAVGGIQTAVQAAIEALPSVDKARLNGVSIRLVGNDLGRLSLTSQPEGRGAQYGHAGASYGKSTYITTGLASKLATATDALDAKNQLQAFLKHEVLHIENPNADEAAIRGMQDDATTQGIAKLEGVIAPAALAEAPVEATAVPAITDAERPAVETQALARFNTAVNGANAKLGLVNGANTAALLTGVLGEATAPETKGVAVSPKAAVNDPTLLPILKALAQNGVKVSVALSGDEAEVAAMGRIVAALNADLSAENQITTAADSAAAVANVSSRGATAVKFVKIQDEPDVTGASSLIVRDVLAALGSIQGLNDRLRDIQSWVRILTAL